MIAEPGATSECGGWGDAAEILDALPVGVALLDAKDLSYRFVNEAYRALLPGRALLGRRAPEVWPEIAPEVEPAAREALSKGATSWRRRTRVWLEGTGPRHHDVAFKRVPGSGLLLVTRVDVTDDVVALEAAAAGERRRWEAERAARSLAEEARARAELLVSVASELSAGVDLRAVFATAIGRATELVRARTGYLLLFEPDGRHLRRLERVFRPGRTKLVLDLEGLPVARAALESGAPRWLGAAEAAGEERRILEGLRASGAILAPLLADRGPLGLLGVVFRGAHAPSAEELSLVGAVASQCALAIDRARAYDAERQARAEACEVARLQQQLMAVVGHDLRTPLSSIVLAAKLLMRRPGLGARESSTLARITGSATRMSTLLRDLIEFGRTRAGGRPALELAEVDAGALCRAAATEVATVYPHRRIAVEERGELLVRADPTRLAQLVSNLVGNAAQHSRPDARIEVVVQGLADQVRFSVHNEGEPIDPGLLPHLFEPFRRGALASGGRTGSVGLGLFIVSEIARAHGGAVAVRSEAGYGTEFTVSLPRSPSSG